MTQPLRLRSILLAALIATGCWTALPAAADDGLDLQLEAVFSLIFEDDFDDNLFGVRASMPISGRFHGQASLSNIGCCDAWLLDVSLRYFFDDRGRSRWYLAGGPGTVFQDLDDLGDTGWLFHLGVGTEIDLTPRFYLRPELLVRWNEDSGLDSVAGDANLGVGWRF